MLAKRGRFPAKRDNTAPGIAVRQRPSVCLQLTTLKNDVIGAEVRSHGCAEGFSQSEITPCAEGYACVPHYDALHRIAPRGTSNRLSFFRLLFDASLSPRTRLTYAKHCITLNVKVFVLIAIKCVAPVRHTGFR